ncbi:MULTISPECIES: hypothetical protein [unclassified Yoonia]|uniref:hypothetical protein n=1 Tax=unclassified Yoonia TaxID=2629118 RepID=UPI002AFFC509|nr:MULTISPECIES: hypothetical protein [unclassified Yoonia]
MTIAVPGSSLQAWRRLFGRKPQKDHISNVKKTLSARDVARLFDKSVPKAANKSAEPAKLNDAEKRERATLSSLRGALYSKD